MSVWDSYDGQANTPAYMNPTNLGREQLTTFPVEKSDGCTQCSKSGVLGKQLACLIGKQRKVCPGHTTEAARQMPQERFQLLPCTCLLRRP